MIVYHGTTNRRAQRICVEGFLPRKPSRRVWFAESRAYALGRAKTQARRSRDRPVVLACDIDIHQMRNRYGAKRILHRNRVIAISAPVPVTVLRSHLDVDIPTTPAEIAAWVNRLLGFKPHRGVSRRHPGIERLARWVSNRLTSQPRAKITPGELLHMAKQWLPDFFVGAEIDPDRLTVRRKAPTIQVELAPPAPPVPDPSDEAIELLEDPGPRRRVRGLEILAKLEDPDLFDWCVMYMDDESVNVRVAALRAMLRCEDGQPEVLAPLAESEDKRIRAAALAALAKHAGDDAPGWFERGLKDPSPCVRLETARLLAELDPAEHRALFELALCDPNPKIAARARKLTAGKGYADPMRQCERK